ncbi:MAG: hypothetical protein ACP5UZ_08990, partial [Thermoplasmata archaeon]
PVGYIIGPLNTFLIEVTGVTVAYFIYHILTNISLGVYFKKIKELSIIKHIIIPTVASVFFAVILYFSIIPITFPVSYGTVLVFVWTVIGIFISLVVKKDRLTKSSMFFSYENLK